MNGDLQSIKGDLFSMFKQQGLDQDLKVTFTQAHMRAQIVQKLRGHHKVKIQSLNTRVICSLFLDFLKKSNFQYTASVFVPECGHADKLLSVAQIAQSFDVPMPPQGKFLQHIIQTFQFTQKRRHMLDSASQTEDFTVISTLEQKFRKLQIDYLNKTRADTQPESLEERMLKYQRESENRYRNQLAAQIARIRELEISALRIEEANKYRQQLQKMRKETQQHWRTELEGLKIREKETRERLSVRQSELENKEYLQRQQFLKDLENLKFRENQMKRAAEIQFEAAKLEKKSWEAKKLESEAKLKDLDALRKQMTHKAQDEFLQYKREYQQTIDNERRAIFHQRQELENQKREVELDLSKANQTLARADLIQKELENNKIRLKQIKHQRDTAQKELAQTRAELRTLSEVARRDQAKLSQREQMISVYQSQLEQVQKLRLEKLNREKVQKQTILQQSDFIAQKKLYWQEIEREEAQVRRSALEMMRVPVFSKVGDPFANIVLPSRSTPNVPQHYSPKLRDSPTKFEGYTKEIQIEQGVKPLEQKEISQFPFGGQREETSKPQKEVKVDKSLKQVQVQRKEEKKEEESLKSFVPVQNIQEKSRENKAFEERQKQKQALVIEYEDESNEPDEDEPNSGSYSDVSF